MEHFVLLYFKLLFIFIFSGAYCFALFEVIISFYYFMFLVKHFVLFYFKLLFIFIFSGAFCFTLF